MIMESPKRKLQRRNDYQRHKLFRKIKRKKKAAREQEQNIAEKELRKKLKLPKFNDANKTRNTEAETYDPANRVQIGDVPEDIISYVPKSRIQFTNDGRFVYPNGAEVSIPLNEVIVSQMMPRDPGEIRQGKEPSTFYKLMHSNPYTEREYEDWRNNRSVLKALWHSPFSLASAPTRAALGIEQLVSDDGIGKTVNDFQNGLYWTGTKSLLGDAVNAAMAIEGIGSTIRNSKNILLNSAHNLSKNKTTTDRFQSELDWSPESWFSTREKGYGYDEQDVKSLASHVPEYLKIEENAKKDGTWLKMPDGSIYTEDPRDWVIAQSDAAKKYSDEIFFHGDDNSYISHGIDVTPETNGRRIMWLSSNPTVGRTYTLSDNRVVPIIIKKGSPLKHKNANGRNWRYAYKTDNGNFESTDYYSTKFLKKDSYLRLDNVDDPGSSFINKNSKYYNKIRQNTTGDDIILGESYPRKNLRGNNGDLDINNPNWFKVTIPLLVGGIYKFNKSNDLESHNSGKDIHIDKNKRGTFTRAAKAHGMGVQEFAHKVLSAPKGKYSSNMRKKANFARNASKFKH